MKNTAIIAVVALVAVVVYLVSTGYIPTQFAIQSEDDMDQIAKQALEENGSDLSKLYHGIIDPYMPGWLTARKSDCGLAGGTWIDQNDRVGCFAIPTGAFDISQCTGPTLTYFGTVCQSLGANWECSTSAVGCLYW